MSPTLPRRARAALVAALTTVLLTPSGPMPATADADVLDGARWYVDPDSAAAREADGRRADDPEAAARFDRIASQPQADWFGDWVPTAEVTGQVARRTATIREAGALPVYVTYAIPARDCGGYSAGGVGTPAEYRDWVEAFAAGLDGGHAVVVVEPDALGLLDCLHCLPGCRLLSCQRLRYCTAMHCAGSCHVMLCCAVLCCAALAVLCLVLL